MQEFIIGNILWIVPTLLAHFAPNDKVDVWFGKLGLACGTVVRNISIRTTKSSGKGTVIVAWIWNTLPIAVAAFMREFWIAFNKKPDLSPEGN